MSKRSLGLARIALVGNPNCGKTVLFNALTGGHAKVGNYPGVTVERKEGQVNRPSGLRMKWLDLPGTYSLDARTPDEMITRDVVLGDDPGEVMDVFVAVADATHLERSLGLILELKSLNHPMLLALNMMDLANRRGLKLDLQAMSQEMGIPIVPVVAIQGQGISELLVAVEQVLEKSIHCGSDLNRKPQWQKADADAIRKRFAKVDEILKKVTLSPSHPSRASDRIDRIVLHPILGSILLILILGLVFQAIFTWAQLPMEWLKTSVTWFGLQVGAHLESGPLRSLIVDGMIAGVGSVLVFLPQILLLFLFILFLEDSGYLPRAAFLMDRLMGRVGLHGRAFIPLLSSFACAIPGIMATRTIESRRDRLATILVSPLMTCSARLPVYSLLIAAFIPNRRVFGLIRLQGLVMLGLYCSGVLAALGVAVILRRSLLQGPRPPLLMELPSYKWPSLRNLFLGLLERCQLFLRRAGTVILAASILLWFFASYPKPTFNSGVPAITSSYAGKMGRVLEPWVRPLGFNWKIAVALIPAFAAREVMIGSLATVYAVEAGEADDLKSVLGEKLAKDWSVATALSLLVWYVLACQCLSTLAITRRETNSWRWPAFMFFYMTTLAYLGSFVTYRLALGLGLG